MITTPDPFPKWQSLILSLTGSQLQTNKSYLLEHRLTPLLASLDLHNLDDLYAAICERGCAKARSMVIEAITTHETSFFRDGKPFDLFSELVRDWLNRQDDTRTRSFRVLCAGCSSGEEAYSVAMILDNILAPLGISWRIRAVDIAPFTLEKARLGRYPSIKGVPEPFQQRYFLKTPAGFVVIKNLRERVYFSEVDLVNPTNLNGDYDVIFYRNVAIYFTAETRLKILAALYKRISPKGFLIIGSGETLGGFKGLRKIDFNGSYCFQK